MAVEPGTSQLKSIVDKDYILLMTEVTSQNKSTSESQTPEEINLGSRHYEFVTCKIVHDMAQAANYRFNAGWEGDPYEFSVRPDTCTPTYTDKEGKSLILESKNLTLKSQFTALTHLENEKNRIDREQGAHYLAAFGMGASFRAFSKNIRQAITSLLPTKIAKLPFMGFIGSIALHSSTGADALQKHVFDKANPSLQSYAVVLPSEGPPQDVGNLSAAELAGAGVAGAGGFAAAQIIINEAAKTGPWGAVIGYVIVPFTTSVLFQTRDNRAKEILENFQKILAIHKPNDAEHMARTTNAHVTARTRSIPEISKLLGETLLLARWAPAQSLHHYCVPAQKSGESPVCAPLATDPS